MTVEGVTGGQEPLVASDRTVVPRFVVDETRFDLSGLSGWGMEVALHRFNELLAGVRSQGHQVGRSPLWDAVDCLPGHPLWEVLSRVVPTDVDRDVLLRTATLMDRCSDWTQPDGSQLEVPLGFAAGPDAVAWSVALAHWSVVGGRGMGCLATAVHEQDDACPRCARGAVEVRHPRDGVARVVFAVEDAQVCQFWRSLFRLERVDEGRFLELAARAFPRLVFAEGLSFRRFDGRYTDLRDRVVEILSGLNDYFAEALEQACGIPDTVQALLGHCHLDVSPESPGTRGNDKLMALRRVVHHGGTYTCEWHAKLERHRNRIHFSLPEPGLDGRILIGVFTDHLPT